MRLSIQSFFIAALLLAVPAFAAHDEVVKPLKLVVGDVRYGKDKKALELFAPEAQGKALLGPDWEKGTEAQRTEFKDLFKSLFGKIAFPKVREDFKYLDSVDYREPKVDGDKATVDSTIVIRHPVKGTQQLKLNYALLNEGGSWHVVDVTVLGDSMLKGIREDQIIPIMKEGGWPNLLKLMHDKAKELNNVTLK